MPLGRFSGPLLLLLALAAFRANAAESTAFRLACKGGADGIALEGDLLPQRILQGAVLRWQDTENRVGELRYEEPNREQGESDEAYVRRDGGSFYPFVSLSLQQNPESDALEGKLIFRKSEADPIEDVVLHCEKSAIAADSPLALPLTDTFTIFSWTGDHSRPDRSALAARRFLSEGGCRVQSVQCEAIEVPAFIRIRNVRTDCSVKAENCFGAELGPEGARCSEGKLKGGSDTILEYLVNRLFNIREFSHYCWSR